MQDILDSIDTDLSGLTVEEWKTELVAIADEQGMSQTLGDRHFATFIDAKSTLLVSFETIQGIQALSDMAQPFGFDMVRAQGWSHLCLIADKDTWFRDSHVYGFFDKLIDDGFFEDFEQVVFYGAGPCGYAAAAFSVASPGATVVAVQPQATLDARMTEWDERFVDMRRTSFTDRFGYAPDMLEAADHAYIIYDPRETLDAMHSALFERPNVSRLRMPSMGSALQSDLITMDMLYQILSLAGKGKLTNREFYKLYRARRNNAAYLRRLMTRLDAADRSYLNVLLCRNVISRMKAPKFRRRLVSLEKKANKGVFTLPPVST